MPAHAGPEEALLFLAVTFRPDFEEHVLLHEVIPQFGTVQLQRPVFAFDYSDYYEAEMGPDLRKTFFIFSGRFSADYCVQTKLQAMELEKKHAVSGKRRINLDPGYLTLAKLVLTTSKNFDHRVYLAQGVFADVQLRYRGGRFVANPWTYPDYKSTESLKFFEQARAYLQELTRRKT